MPDRVAQAGGGRRVEVAAPGLEPVGAFAEGQRRLLLGVDRALEEAGRGGAGQRREGGWGQRGGHGETPSSPSEERGHGVGDRGGAWSLWTGSLNFWTQI